MPNCAAYGCVNRSSKCNLSFHRLPNKNKRQELRKKWLINMRRDGTLPKDDNIFLCAEHFEEHCFERDLKVC